MKRNILQWYTPFLIQNAPILGLQYNIIMINCVVSRYKKNTDWVYKLKNI